MRFGTYPDIGEGDLAGEDLPPALALRKLAEGRLELPEGCSVDIQTEALDMLEQLAKYSREDALLYEYVSYRDAHGRRPSAAELYSTGVHFKPITQRYGSWFDFVAAQGDLTDDEARTLSAHAPWFRDLLTTKMTKSYKMIALQALLDAEALFDRMDVEDNAHRSYQLIKDHVALYRELREDQDRHTFGAAFIRKWKQMPLGVWARADPPPSRGSPSKATPSSATSTSTTPFATPSKP